MQITDLNFLKSLNKCINSRYKISAEFLIAFALFE